MSTLVIGAGAVGLSCAFEVIDRGEEVIIVDAGAIGAAASAGNAGWVTPFLSTPRAAPGAFQDAMKSFFRKEGPAKLTPRVEPGFISWSLRFLQASTKARNLKATSALQALSASAPESFDSLGERGVDFEHHKEGLGIVFKSRDNYAQFRELVSKTRGIGYRGAIAEYEGKAVREFEPAVSRSVMGMIHLEDERHVRPESFASGLGEAIQAKGGQIVENDAVANLSRDGACWVARLRSGRNIKADKVIVAAGFHSRHVLRQVGVNLPLEAAKGISATMSGSGTKPQLPLKLYEDMVACSPFQNSLRLSGTFDIGARDSRLNRKRLDMVVRQGLGYLEDWTPERRDIEWVGHRPTSADDLPVIGAVEGQDGLFVATGHGTLGVTLGPITGKLLANEILTGVAEPLLEPFRISRF